MLHAARQLPSWLIFDVRQKVEFSQRRVRHMRIYPMNMSRFVRFVLAALTMCIAVGCSKNPASFAGTWRCQTTLVTDAAFGGKSPVAHVVTITLGEKGEGSLSWIANEQEQDSATGQWEKVGSYVVIDRQNGGFAAFKVVSKVDTKMTLINRTGLMLEFTKIK